MNIRAVGFDLGDTLIFYRDTPMNWTSLYPAALQRVAEACLTRPTPEQFAAAEQILKQNNTRIFPRTNEVTAADIFSPVLRAWNIPEVPHLPAAIEAYFTFFQQRMEAYPDTIPALTLLRERRVPVGILTDVPYGMPRSFVQRDVDQSGISNLFDALITSVEVGLRKPDPAGYLALAERLKIPPREMLYVGNEPKDVIGACHAGLTAVFLDRSGNGGNHGQHFTISTLAALEDFLGDRG